MERLNAAGGHIELGESIVDAVIREMKEETGLTIIHPKLCGIKQFPIENGRYLVFLFETNDYSGDVISSEEGEMYWVKKSELSNLNTVGDINELLQVMLDGNLTEFQYVLENDKWNILIR